MIKPSDRPEVFDYLEKGYSFFELHDEKSLYGYLALRKKGITADIHIEHVRWGHNVLKHMRDVARLELHKMCRLNGVTRLVARKADDPTWLKYIRLFGFCEPQCIWLSYLEIEDE